MLRHDTGAPLGLLQVIPEHAAPQHGTQVGILLGRTVQRTLEHSRLDRLGQLAGQSEDRRVRPVNRRRENFGRVIQAVPVRLVRLSLAHAVSSPKNSRICA